MGRLGENFLKRLLKGSHHEKEVGKPCCKHIYWLNEWMGCRAGDNEYSWKIAKRQCFMGLFSKAGRLTWAKTPVCRDFAEGHDISTSTGPVLYVSHRHFDLRFEVKPRAPGMTPWPFACLSVKIGELDPWESPEGHKAGWHESSSGKEQSKAI